MENKPLINYAQCKVTENVGIKNITHLSILEEVNVYNSPFLTSEKFNVFLFQYMGLNYSSI